MWDVSAGGHVLAGEFGFQAVMRECEEELGIKLDKNDITFIGATTSTNLKGDVINNHFNEYYIVKKDVDIRRLTLDKEEVQDIKWVNAEDLIVKINNNYDTLTTKEGCWEYLKKYLELNKNI